MSATSRPRRSVLYMPGSKERALEKARNLPADALILDLEDAVTPAEKDAARDLVVQAVGQGGYAPREVVIRINGLETPWGADDLTAAAKTDVDAIVVPKVESDEMLQDIIGRMDAAGASPDMGVWAMMETPLGVLNAAQIAGSTPRLKVLVMGTNDLVKDLGAQHVDTRQPVMTALGLSMLAARAHGLAILDGVYNAFKDDAGLERSCLQGLEMGFDGKTLIHPAQLEVTNRVFAPSADQIELAQRQVEAFNEAEAKGLGIAVVDGQIVENLHVETAKALLAKADTIAAMERAAQ